MPPTKILVIVTGEIQRSGEMEFIAKSIEKPKSAATPTP